MPGKKIVTANLLYQINQETGDLWIGRCPSSLWMVSKIHLATFLTYRVRVLVSATLQSSDEEDQIRY